MGADLTVHTELKRAFLRRIASNPNASEALMGSREGGAGNDITGITPDSEETPPRLPNALRFIVPPIDPTSRSLHL